MTVAEKTLLLKQDFDDVKQAGRFNPIMSSENLNGNVSGVAIAVNDVVDMGHSVGVRLSSKNLYKPEFRTNDSAVNYTDGVLFVPQYGGNTYVCDCLPLYIPQNTWLYYKHTLLLGKDRVVIRLYNSNGENISTTDMTNIECSSTWYLAAYKGYVVEKPANGFSFKVTSNVAYITFGYCGMNSEGGNKYGDIQLELGTTATEYTPYVENLGGIEVSRLGKNLALAKDVYKDFNQFRVVEFEGRTAVRFLDNKEARWAGISFKPNTQYTVSFEARITKREEIDTKPTALFYFFYSDGTTSKVLGYRNTEWEHFTLTSAAGKTVVALGMNSYGFYNFPYIDCDSFQLEEGSTATAYEPYNRTTYQSIADGTVEGVTSIAPNMTLLSDNNSVVINAHYYKDPDIVISNLQQSVALSGGE